MKHSEIIKSIHIRDLFDTYSYDLTYHNEAGFDKLVILYGDNGSGKTTILNLTYHLLSPEPLNGHRSAVGSVIFREFWITFYNGFSIHAVRETPVDGRYKIVIKDGGIESFVWEWLPEDKGAKDDPTYQQLCNFLKQLRINIFFLSDNRRTSQDEDEGEKELARRTRSEFERSLEFAQKKDKNRDLRLDLALTQFKQWIREQVIVQTNRGFKSVNDLYIDIIRGISTQDKEFVGEAISREALIEKIEEIDKRNQTYKRFGLSSDFLKKDVARILRTVDEEKLVLVNTVLSPYLDSFELRLQSLERLQIKLKKLETYLSDFYKEKVVKIDLDEGIRIFSRKERPIEPSKLSSGERQVLLLFCYVIVANENSSLIIIDEPEISLNIKWQRILLAALLDLLDETNSQVMIATHSIEMIAKYKDLTSPLRNSNDH